MVHKLKIRRIFAAWLILTAMLLGLAVPAAAVSVSDFKDVSSSAWYYGAVSYVTAKGLFNGTGSTTFSPQGTMTRGMFVTVLGRYAGVDPDAWRAGTVTGSGVNLRTGPGTGYGVTTTMSRNETVTILGKSGDWYRVRYGNYTGYAAADYVQPKYHRFSDVDYSAYYAGYVIWGYEKGIVNGMSSSVFAPNDNVTREQICKLLHGYASYAGLSLTAGSAVSFSDQSSISSWASAGVAAMQAAGVVIGEKSGSGYIFRPRSSATRAEAAAIFQRFDSAASGSGGTSTPAPTNTPAPTATPGGTSEDTPATFLSDPVAVKAKTVRVGILVNTQSYRDAVQTVSLQNLNSGGFEYGVFDSDRSFRRQGAINSSSVTVTTNGSTFTVKNASGTVVYTGGGNLAIHPTSSGKTVTRVNGNYRYYGDFELRQAYSASGYISVINYVDIEDYVKGVVPFEFGNTWPMETLKAAAIVVRSFVMSASWNTYSGYGFDVMNNTSFQVYRGRGITYSESYYTDTDAATDATKGVYLTYNYSGTNRICSTYFFACDGGATEDAAHIWGSGYSYLIGKKDPYEAAASKLASNYEYSITNSRTGSVMTNLASRVGLGNTTIAKDGIKIDTYPATGNVRSIIITGTNGRTVTISQSSSFDRWDFLSAFGFTAYSYRYKVTYNAASDTFTCTRNGWGHNVGLSQWGAYAMAKYYNKSYQDILGFYYTGTHLQNGAY